MIVKNERLVIERCLDSLKSIIDYWVIVDTGSTDGTQEIIRSFMADIPGELHERPWVDFGHNRSEALKLARDKANYCLTIDADAVYALSNDFSWSSLNNKDCFMIPFEDQGYFYQRCQIVNNKHFWEYKGVLHEYIFSEGVYNEEEYPGIKTIAYHDGARSANPNKYFDDVALLQKALQKDPTNSRHVFYLAQSCRDAGLYEKSLEYYHQRSEMGGWNEEVWYSFYQVAELLRVLEREWDLIEKANLVAFAYFPNRAEPLYALMTYYIYKEIDFEKAHFYGKKAMDIPFDSEHLFIEKDIYEWQIPLEYAVCCYEIGDHKTALSIYANLLLLINLSDERKEIIITNRQFSLDLV